MTAADSDSPLGPQFIDLREYDRLQFLQMNGGMAAGAGGGVVGPGAPRGPQADFEETIHRVS